MNQRLLARSLVLVVVLSLAAIPCTALIQAQGERGPSTPEERAKALRLTRQLELDPLGKDAKEARQWLTVWLIHVPDIVVYPCGSLLGPVVNTSKDDYSAELTAQMNFSQAAYIIEHPQKASDNHALLTASLEGALKAYEAILKKRPAARRPYLDDLLARRNQGEIGAYVSQAMGGCR